MSHKKGENTGDLRIDENKEDCTSALSSITCLPTCEGIAKRVLKDLGEYDLQELKIAYFKDENNGGNNYKSIIELGELLKTLL